MQVNIKKVSLVLEGGAMRGSFTAGVISLLMDKEITFPYVIGISAGASNALNYVSKQKERARICFVEMVSRPEYYGIRHFIRGNGIFNTKFLYDELPMKVLPYDYKAFFASDIFIKLGAVHAKSASMRYWSREEIKTPHGLNMRLRASSSMPLVMPITKIDGEDYVDGGVVDSIPIEEAIRDGNEKQVVVLTQQKGYIKERQKLNPVTKFWLRDYPKLLDAISNRHLVYNRTIKRIEDLEKQGNAFVIRPGRKLVSRTETNTDRLMESYKYGYEYAESLLPELMKFVRDENH